MSHIRLREEGTGIFWLAGSMTGPGHVWRRSARLAFRGCGRTLGPLLLSDNMTAILCKYLRKPENPMQHRRKFHASLCADQAG